MQPAHDAALFHDPDVAIAHLETLRWPSGPVCPFCRQSQLAGSDKDAGGHYTCDACDAAFTVTTRTVMERSAMTLPQWLKALSFLSQAKEGRTLEATLQGMLTPHDTDPDLRLLVDDQVVRPQYVDNLVFSFAVPASPKEIRILSRYFIPSKRDPSGDDRRRLGISLYSIAIKPGDAGSEWLYDDPALTAGFHKAEAGHRWTNGRAVVPRQYYANVLAPFTLRVRLAHMDVLYGLED